MAKRRTNNAVSLFPFLAVLVCTMGALILLLLVTTRRIRQKQQAEAVAQLELPQEQPPTRPLADVPAEPVVLQADWDQAQLHLQQEEQEYRRVLEQLSRLERGKHVAQQRLQQLQAELDQQQQLIAANADESISAGKQLLEEQQAEQELQTAILEQQQRLNQAQQDSQLAQQQLQMLQEQAEQLQLQLDDKTSALETLIREQQQRSQDHQGTEATVVSFSNSTGTVRQPMIVDLTADGFVFPSTGVRLRREDLLGSQVRDNPLLAGILATHRHRSGDEPIGRPYVLLLVRPDGLLGFYPAQRILKESGIHFGFELLENDVVVEAADPVAGEGEAVRTAVLKSLLRRQQQLAGATEIRRQIADLQARQRRQQQQLYGPEAQGWSRRDTDGADLTVADQQSSASVAGGPTDLPARGQAESHSAGSVVQSIPPGNAGQPARASRLYQSFGPDPHRTTTRQDIEDAFSAALADRAARRAAAGSSQNGGGQAAPLPNAERGSVVGNDTPPQVWDNLPQSAETLPAGDGDSSQDLSPTQRAEPAGQQPPAELWQPDAPGEWVAAPQPQDGMERSTVSVDTTRPPIHEESDEFWSNMQALDPTSPTAQPLQQDGLQRRAASAGPAHRGTGPTVAGGHSQAAVAAAGEQLAEQALPLFSSELGRGYQQVSVYVDAENITVGDQGTFSLSDLSLDQVVAQVLQRLSDALRDNPHPVAGQMLPAPRLVVSPGAQVFAAQLAQRLRALNIPVESRGTTSPWLPAESSLPPSVRLTTEQMARATDQETR